MMHSGVFDLDFVLENFRLMTGQNYLPNDLVITRDSDHKGNPLVIIFRIIGSPSAGYAIFLPGARQIKFITSKGIEKISKLATRFV